MLPFIQNTPKVEDKNHHMQYSISYLIIWETIDSKGNIVLKCSISWVEKF